MQRLLRLYDGLHGSKRYRRYPGRKAFRQTFDTEVPTEGGEVFCAYLSAACMHCEDAPCIAACPAGCISKDPETGFTIYDNTNCIGCKSCESRCPFGVKIAERMAKTREHFRG